jgi:hypothetical protein
MLKAFPDTALVLEASKLASQTLSPGVLEHSRRTFLLGREYGQKRAMSFDEEGLLLAALFHDFGLADGIRDRKQAFTEVSASKLEEFLHGRCETSRSSALAEAIELHMQLFPRWSRGPEAGLLQVGAWMDVVGLRRGTVGAEYVEAVESAHPKSGFTVEFHRRFLSSLGSFRACYRLVAPRKR